MSSETAVALSRGVTDAEGTLADLVMQVADQALRSKITLEQATGGLTTFINQLGTARQTNTNLFTTNNDASAQARAKGQAFRDQNFETMARAAVQSMSEIETERRLDDLQETLSWLGMIPGFGIVFDIVNVQISVARGNYDDAKLYAVLALPYVGTVAGVALLGYALGQYLVADSHSAASQAEDPDKMLNPVYRVPWVSGRGGGNSFAAGTGVVTGVDENGNPITTNIEDLQIGDVVLAGNELDPSDPNHYTLVTDVSSRTVYEQTEITYVDDAGNIEVIKTTDNHEFYVEGSGWTTAANLQQGDTLTLSDGRTALVTTKTTIAVPEGVTVYNLSVSDGSTYFVDDGQGSVSAVWVHNARVKVGRTKTPMSRATKRYTKKAENLNSNSAKSNFGIYEIRINGRLHKIGKADLNRVTKRTGLPTRLHTQIRKLEKVFGVGNVKGKVVQDLGRVTTKTAKEAEYQTILKVFKKTGQGLLGNWKSFRI